MLNLRRIRRAFPLTVALCAILASSPAAADGTADEADLHFRLGKGKYKRGDYEGALVHFFLSNRLVANRNVLFNIAGAYEAMKHYGDAYRYYVDAMEGEGDEQKRADVQRALDRLAPNIAVLDIATDPPGATLYIQRRDLGTVGRSPRPLALSPGRFRVIAELEGYEPLEYPDVELVQGRTTRLELSLSRIVGKVRVEVKGGASALVRVDREDGPPACVAPCDLALIPGRHDLYFAADGYAVLPRTVIVEARQTALVSATLVSLTGSLLVRTEESGARVLLDGRPIGFTPLVAGDIPQGKHTVRVEASGARPREITVDVRPGAQVELANVALDPLEEGLALREVTAASRAPEDIDDAPQSVTVIDRREISALGYPTIYEAIRGVRGVALANDRAYPTASVRGIGQPGDYGNRFLVLSEGHSLNENVGASSFIAHEARADLNDVERIEIVRGPGALLYGTGAISGVLNLILRPPDGPDEVRVGAGVYDNNVAHAGAGFTRNFGPGRGVWGSVSTAYSEGFDLGVPLPGSKANAPPVAHGVESFSSVGTAGRATFDAWTAQWFYHQRYQNVPVGAYGSLFDDPRTTLEERRFAGEIRYEPRVGKDLQVFARVHGNYYDTPAAYRVEGGVYREEYTGAWFGAEARVVYTPRPWLRFTAGAAGQIHPDASMIGVSDVDGVKSEYLDEKHPYGSGAGYLVAEGVPASWLRFSGGVRVDGDSTFGAILVPRAALLFKPAAGHTLKIMGGRAFRAPSVYELYYNDGGLTQVVAEDKTRGMRLSPESSYSGEIEYSLRFRSDWVALAAAHVTVVQGIIGLAPDKPGSDLVRYANGSAPALVAGGDVEIRREWRRGTMFAASYGIQRAQTLDKTVANPILENAPSHLASARFVTPLFRDLASLGFRATIEAPRRIRSDSDRETKPAIVADATVSGAITEIGIRYVVGVYNLADWHYEVPIDGTFASRTMPQNGRRFLFDLQWAFR